MAYKFKREIRFKLKLKPKDGDDVTVKCGDLKVINLRLTNYGWSGELEFYIFDDKKAEGIYEDTFFEVFQKSQPIDVEIDVWSWFDEGSTYQKVSEVREAVTLRGLVTKRSFGELEEDRMVEGKRVLWRRYRIECQDTAAVLWKQHNPCMLYADMAMADLIEKHAGDAFKVKFDSGQVKGESEFTKKHRMIFFALDPSIGKASFYDFVMWWADRHRLLFNYEYGADTETYTFALEKSDIGDPIPFFRNNVYGGPGIGQPRAHITLPEIPRWKLSVLNSFTGKKIVLDPVENAEGIAPTRRDVLLRTPLDKEMTDRQTYEKARMELDPSPLVSFSFVALPSDPLFPGERVEFKKDEQRFWNSDAWYYDKPLRVFEVRLTARATRQAWDECPMSPQQEFEMTYDVDFELNADKKTPRLPAFVEPVYPVHVEGHILSGSSDVGPADAVPGQLNATKPSEQIERTYDPVTRDNNGIPLYHVVVPIWKDTAKQILVPYNPGNMPGQLFFPAYKHERVLLGMTWRKAWIDSFLDWRPGASMSSEAQGNRMYLGKKDLYADKESSTSLTNFYAPEKKEGPFFEVARTHANDKQTILLTEGDLTIEVKEDTTAAVSTGGIKEIKESDQS